MQQAIIRRGTAERADGRAAAPDLRFRVRNHQDLVEKIARATRRRVTLVRGPAGSGKTLACSLWAARQLGSRVVWLTLSADDDQALFWARVYHGLLKASTGPVAAMQALADASAAEFPLRLAEVARAFTSPVVLVIDNAHVATSDSLLHGLDLLIRNAPPSLRIVFAGRRGPELPQLARLEAAGEMAIVGLGDVASPASAAVRSGTAQPGGQPLHALTQLRRFQNGEVEAESRDMEGECVE